MTGQVLDKLGNKEEASDTSSHGFHFALGNFRPHYFLVTARLKMLKLQIRKRSN